MFKELGALMSLMGNKDKIQSEVAKFQQTVAQITAEGTAGGGMVTVKANGKLEVTGLTIADDALKNDREMLEDLIVAATNQALAKVREQLAAKSAEMANNIGLPPSMLAGLGGSLPGMG